MAASSGGRRSRSSWRHARGAADAAAQPAPPSEGRNEVLGEVVHRSPLVDFAGSERVEKSGVVGEQLRRRGANQ